MVSLSAVASLSDAALLEHVGSLATLERRTTAKLVASLAELDTRIAILRANLRELVEQAAAYSGAADEARNADRIANQEARLAELLKERDKLAKS